MDAALLIMLRNARGLSVEELAERVEVHPDTIERWEAGDTRVPYPANRRRLANALGVPLGPLVVAVWGKQQGIPEAVIETNRRIVLQAAGLLPAALLAPAGLPSSFTTKPSRWSPGMRPPRLWSGWQTPAPT